MKATQIHRGEFTVSVPDSTVITLGADVATRSKTITLTFESDSQQGVRQLVQAFVTGIQSESQ